MLTGLLLVWGFVWLQLWEHSSKTPRFFGRYSLALLLVIVAYGFSLLPLLYFLYRPAPLARQAQRLLSFVQARAWLALPLIAGLLLLIHVAFNWLRFVEGFPGLQLVTVTGAYVLIGVLVFHGWRRGRPVALWRQAALAILVALLAFEVLLQLLSLFQALPDGFSSEDGLYRPYGRLYDGRFGGGNGLTNRHGWHARPFALAEGPRRVMLIGDEFIYAGDSPPEQQLGAWLEQELAAAGQPAAVLSVGAPGYGPAHYFEGVKNGISYFQPDDMVVFINVRNDFLNLIPDLDRRRADENIYYDLEADGFWNINEASLLPQHLFLHGFSDPARPMSDNVLLTVRSHVLSTKLLRFWLAPTVAAAADELPDDALASLGPGRFAFEQTPPAHGPAETALSLTENLLAISHQAALVNGANLYVVVIPAFSQEFYAAGDTGQWQTAFGRFDLLAPESRLVAFAAEAGIPLLGTGALLRQQGTAPAQIAGWYGPGGQSLSPAGHQAFAALVYEAFFAR